MIEAQTNSFKNIKRMHDDRFPHEIAVLLPGDYFVSHEPMIVYTVLGSCISACIRDPVLGVGGMNHFMLPAPKEKGAYDSWGESARYGNFAMELMINEIIKRGRKKERFEVKIFGGGKIYEGMNDVGARNGEWILKYLKEEGLQPLKSDIGDLYPRKIYYFTDSGRVLLKRLRNLRNQTIIEREQKYKAKLGQEKKEDNVTLF